MRLPRIAPIVTAALGLLGIVAAHAALNTPPETPKVRLLCASQQLGQIVTNSTAETAFVFQATCLIPANTLSPGDELDIEQDGVYQSGLSQSVQPFIRIGPAATALTARPLLITTNGAVSGLLNANTDTPWGASTRHIVQANGTSIVSGGRLFFSTSATAALVALVANINPVTFNPAVDNVLTASVSWTNASSANQIRATTWRLTIMKP